jgi:hypothetical protein
MSRKPLSLFPVRSYDSEPDYIDEFGNEVRINRNRPNERQVGRFTIVDDISPEIKPKKSKKSKKSKKNKPKKSKKSKKSKKNKPKSSSPKLNVGQKIGRFTVKYIKSPSKIKLGELKLITSRSPRNSRSPKFQIGRFTIKKNNSYLKS